MLYVSICVVILQILQFINASDGIPIRLHLSANLRKNPRSCKKYAKNIAVFLLNIVYMPENEPQFYLKIVYFNKG